MTTQLTPPALCALVRQFNLAPAAYVDASWLPSEWLPRLGVLRAGMHARTAAALSRWLLQEHGLADQFDFDFAAHEKRIALIDAPALRTLARYLGLSIYARCLRRVVQRDARAALVRHIGAEAYEFALHRAVPLDLDCGAARIDVDAGDVDARLLSAGSECLLAALPEAAEATARRVQLKLPRREAGAVTPRRTDAAALRRLLVRRLIPEVTPQWAWLF